MSFLTVTVLIKKFHDAESRNDMSPIRKRTRIVFANIRIIIQRKFVIQALSVSLGHDDFTQTNQKTVRISDNDPSHPVIKTRFFDKEFLS